MLNSNEPDNNAPDTNELPNAHAPQGRIESDSCGDIMVPADCYWGAQTQRSIELFKIGGQKMPVEVIMAIVEIKKAAAQTNASLKKIDANLALSIIASCDQILAGKYGDQFPLVVWQTGSGTQTNMNVNEVIANIANVAHGSTKGSKSPVHPNDHVNFGQSSNDTFPTAMHIAAFTLINNQLLGALESLSNQFKLKANEVVNLLKIARTHLQDATPMSVEQELLAFKRQIDANIERLKSTFSRLCQLAQGGTAVGTGLNCPSGFQQLFIQNLNQNLKTDYTSATNLFEALASHDTMLEVSGALNVLAASLLKIANDFRLLGSGPRCGLNEYLLPENEPGSSIMPGKVNPTQAEALSIIAAQIMGNNVAITVACSQGHLQLNVFKPVIIYNLLESIKLLTDGVNSFNEHCLAGLSFNLKQLNSNLENSLMMVTALNPIIGYEKAAMVAKFALKMDCSLVEAAQQLGYLSAEDFKKFINPKQMI